MILSYSKKFIKQYSKQSPKIKDKFIERQGILVINPFHPFLNNHQLSGKYIGCKSINITGDIRAVFEEINNNHIEFVTIGSHSELYS